MREDERFPRTFGDHTDGLEGHTKRTRLHLGPKRAFLYAHVRYNFNKHQQYMELFESNTGRVEHFRTKIVNCVDHRGFGVRLRMPFVDKRCAS